MNMNNMNNMNMNNMGQGANFIPGMSNMNQNMNGK